MNHTFITYFDRLIECEFNVYHNCIHVYQTNEPFNLEIRFECHFLKPITNGMAQDQNVKSLYRFSETDIRSLIEAMQANDMQYILGVMHQAIQRLIEGVEKLADQLSGYQFDRKINEAFYQRTISIFYKQWQ